MKSSSIGAKLLTLSGVLLLCLLGMGALSWYNSRQLGGTLHLASQSIRGVISDSASAAGQLVEECRSLNGVIADSDAQKEAERRLNYSAMGETALRLMDRRIDNAKFLADACVKSEEVRANVSGFMHVSQTEGGDNPGAYNGADDPKEARNRLEDFVAALTSSAGADFYAVVGVGGKLNGKVLSSNKDTLYNENLSSSPLIVTAIRNNRISKGFDRIGKNMTLASAAFIKNKKGEDVAVFMAGYTVDAPALRFLAEDLRANVSLYLPGAGGKMGLAHTTVTGEDGKLAQQVAIPQNVTQAFESKLAANRADKSKTSNSGTLRKEFSHITHLDVGPLRYDGAFQAIFTEAGELGGVLFVGRNSTESVAKETAIHQRAAQAVTKADAIEQSWRIPDVTQSGNTSGAKENSLTQALSVANRSQVILKRAATLTVVGICTSFLLGAALSWGMTRSIRNTLNRLMGMLKYTASQVESSSAHVSEFSHSLAEGASSQAASLEETSASLEEILSMTRRNSDNAQQAKSLANETRQAAEAGTAEILAMNQAISEMKTSSDTVGKIIKTIDEIAFQTNILALNAAIEAARAGEAGLGFAVVADEVRNLAHRSTEASRETAATIEQSIRTSGRGVALSQKVGQRLDEILQRVRNVDQLVGDIAAASTEQTHGIQQVNQAVSAMDTITQTNAAGAEEGASAGEHLINQSKELNLVVVELEKMVGGRSSIAGSEPKSPPSNPSGDGFPSPKDSGLHRTIRPKESAIAA